MRWEEVWLHGPTPDWIRLSAKVPAPTQLLLLVLQHRLRSYQREQLSISNGMT